MTTPDISIVIPTFNRRASLQVTLNSLRAQTIPSRHFEVIVISDGSTDDTDLFVSEFARSSPYTLRFLRQENAGPARARNRGLRDARNPLAVLLDDDVEAVPGFLEAHRKHHRDTDPLAVIGPMAPDPARARIEPPWIAWEHAMLQKQYENFRDGTWSPPGPNHFYSGNASFLREHALAVGGFNEAFTRQEDIELAYRMTRQRGVKFHFEPDAHGIHRPQRSFESWFRVPAAYGTFDVQRARNQQITWETIRHAYYGRNSLTRKLADLVVPRPNISPILRATFRQTSITLHRLGRTRAAVQALSALYNVRYLEAVAAELGGPDAFREMLRLSPTPGGGDCDDPSTGRLPQDSPAT